MSGRSSCKAIRNSNGDLRPRIPRAVPPARKNLGLVRAPKPPPSGIEPPDLPATIGCLLYPDRPGAVVRFAAEMLGTHFMADYPWCREHGWTASN